MSDLAASDCQNRTVTPAERAALFAQLDPSWKMADDGTSLKRSFVFRGFAKATYTANLAAFISDQTGHHADIAFGWGYCDVIFTSHDAGGLTENDFICATKLDRVIG